MERKEIGFTEHYDAVVEAMTSRGLLLAAYDSSGRPNAMTIGWGTMGSIWSMPMWIVLVRPSRYTYECIEHSGCFTVNAAPAAMAEALMICGTRSGRDGDKLADAALTAEKARLIEAPTLAECPIVYECEVVHCNDLVPDALAKEIRQSAYAGGDFHRVYFGRILAAAAAENAAELVR